MKPLRYYQHIATCPTDLKLINKAGYQSQLDNNIMILQIINYLQQNDAFYKSPMKTPLGQTEEKNKEILRILSFPPIRTPLETKVLPMGLGGEIELSLNNYHLKIS